MKSFLTKEELAVTSGITLQEAEEILQTYDNVISIQAREEAIHDLFKEKYIDPVLKSKNYHGLDSLCNLFAETIKRNLYEIQLHWRKSGLDKRTFEKITLKKEEEEYVYQNAGMFKKLYKGQTKKESILFLMKCLSSLNISVNSFVQLIRLCEEYEEINMIQNQINKNLWDKQITKVKNYKDIKKLSVLVNHLPPLYCRFQARDVLYQMEVEQKKRNK